MGCKRPYIVKASRERGQYFLVVAFFFAQISFLCVFGRFGLVSRQMVLPGAGRLAGFFICIGVAIVVMIPVFKGELRTGLWQPGSVVSAHAYTLDVVS